MGIEIERKFLVTGTAWKENATAVPCCQGYLCPGSGVTVRVRTMGGQGFLTVKGRGDGLARPEYEYEIPLAEAREMLATLCVKPLIVKERYRVVHGGLVWEVDEFAGENRGLVLAEVELAQPEQAVSLPDWVGREVSGDSRYYNASLVSNPTAAGRTERGAGSRRRKKMTFPENTDRQGELQIDSGLEQYFVDISVDCPYGLPRKAVYHQAMFTSIGDATLGMFFAHGYRRNGNCIYSMRCPGCSACVPIRLRPEDFRSQPQPAPGLEEEPGCYRRGCPPAHEQREPGPAGPPPADQVPCGAEAMPRIITPVFSSAPSAAASRSATGWPTGSSAWPSLTVRNSG